MSGKRGATHNRWARTLLLGAAALLAACDGPEPPPHLRVAGGDPARGRALVAESGCLACHVVSGFRVGGRTGPPLENLADRSNIAGSIPNHPSYMVRWLMDPPALAPRTAMPSVGLTEAEARDLAAYLYAFSARRMALHPEPPLPRPALDP